MEEDGGMNLYGYTDNDGVDNWDVAGLWIGPEKSERIVDGEKKSTPGRQSAKPKATACAELGDTWGGLADKVGLDKSEAKNWVTNYDIKPKPGKTYEVPNTVIAYWGGADVIIIKGESFGKGIVKWVNNITYLKSLGFKVDYKEYKKSSYLQFQRLIEDADNNRTLHGIYYWGHGNKNGLTADASPNQPDLLYKNYYPNPDSKKPVPAVSLKYKLALGLVYACYSNTGQPLLSAKPGNDKAIWKGFPKILIPLGDYRVSREISPGQQSTQIP